jgi:ribosomal protein S18 acetylase RimI-like enzyme
MNFTLRPATLRDVGWLFGVRRATMRGYVEEAYGVWDDRAQRERFERSNELDNIRIILLDQRSVGLLHVERNLHDVFLANIQIEPEFQNRGLGTAVIRSILAEGQKANVPVRLQVLKVNHAARRLYERLGFSITDENDSHTRMIWRPSGHSETGEQAARREPPDQGSSP